MLYVFKTKSVFQHPNVNDVLYKSAGSGSVFKAKSIDCKSNPEYIVNTSCNLVPVNWFKSYINADGYLVQTLNNPIVS